MVDGGPPTIDTFLIRPNAYPAKILENGCPTWPDNRGCTVFAFELLCNFRFSFGTADYCIAKSFSNRLRLFIVFVLLTALQLTVNILKYL